MAVNRQASRVQVVGSEYRRRSDLIERCQPTKDLAWLSYAIVDIYPMSISLFVVRCLRQSRKSPNTLPMLPRCQRMALRDSEAGRAERFFVATGLGCPWCGIPTPGAHWR